MSAKAYDNVRSFPVSATAIAQYLRVKLSSGNLALAGAIDNEVGVMESPTFTTDTRGSVRMLGYTGTVYCVANGAITINTVVYRAASGKISSTVSGPAFGLALQAASGDGSVIEVKPFFGTRVASGQATTVTASDTIATGLSVLTAVVATLDDNPGDDPEFVSASIGDQSAAPIAGSFYLKTWKNTGGTDPTPLAATTFSKKVNWIAYGS